MSKVSDAEAGSSNHEDSGGDVTSLPETILPDHSAHIAEALPALISYVDKDQRYRFVNESYQRWMGVRPDDIIGQHVASALGEEMYRKVLPFVERALSGEKFRFESTFLYKTAGERHVVAEYVPDVDLETGEVRGFYGIVQDFTERKRVEEELVRRDLFTSHLLDSSPDCIKTIDLSGRLLSMSRSGLVQLELECLDNYIGKPYADFWGEDDREDVQRALDDALAGGTGHFQGYCPSSTGRHLWWDVVLSPIKGPDGRPESLLAVSRNITEQRQADANQTLLFRIAEMIRRAESPESLIGETVQAIGKHLGVSRAIFMEVDQDAGLAMIHQDYHLDGQPSIAGPLPLAQFSPGSIDILREGRTLVNDDVRNNPRTAQYYEKGYKPLSMEAFLGVPLMHEGRWIAGLAVVQDRARQWTDAEIGLVEAVAERSWLAVERLRSEAALRESEERYRSIVNQTVGGIAEIDLTGMFMTVNDRMCEITGYSREELIGSMRMQDVTHPEDLPGNLEQIKRLVRTGEPFEIEKRYMRKDGTEVWVDNSVSLVRDGRGNPRSIVAAIFDLSERKRTEAALRESEERLRLATSGGGVGTWQADMTIGRGTWSAESVRLMGGKRSEFSVDDWLEPIHPDDRAIVADAWARTEVDDSFYEVEFRTIAKAPDGGDRWLLSRGAIKRDAEGRPVTSAGVLLDITRRKRAESALRESSELLQRSRDTFYSLVQNSPFGIYVVDADFRLVEVAAGARKVFENVDPLLGRDFAEVLHEIWPEPFAIETIKLFRYTLETGEPYHSPNTVEHRNDIHEVESYDWKIERIVLPDGRYGVVCHFYDLSERIQYEQAVRESEMFTRRVLDNLFAFVGVLTPDGTLLEANRAPMEAAGITAGDVIGKKFWDCYWWTFSEYERTRLREAIGAAMHGEVIRYDMQVRMAGEELIWVDFQIAPLYDSEGRVTHLIPSGMDITERKRLLAEAEAANRSKDDFLAILSHELRTPLNSMKGWATILKAGVLDEAQTDEAIDVIARNIEAQNNLIEDILDVSRIVSGKLVIHEEPTSLVPVIANSIQEVQPLAEERSVTLSSDLGTVDPTVSGDPLRLQQVLNNLLNNAIKFTAAGGAVTVKLTHGRNEAIIEVKDSGIGMSADVIPRIFDRFQQADSSTRRRHGGLGLGLAIVRHIVDLHGGTISAESEGEGMGSMFTVRLPLLTAGMTDSHSDRRDGSVERNGFEIDDRLSGIRVLVVDDEPDSLSMIVTALEAHGASAEPATSAIEALDLVKRGKFDVIISDLGMPEEDGFDLIRAIRGDVGLDARSLPAIALSGYAGSGARDSAHDAGYQLHLAKPVDVRSLPETIWSLVDGRT